MGSVYLATQIAVDRKVAVKILATMAEEQQDVMKSRFKREARVIAALQHPNIVQMIDFGESKRGRLYLVMEYIDGQSFTELIKTEAPLDAGRVVDLAIQVLEALSTAHRMGVVHRDLKPDNLMLARNVGVRGDFVKVLDFGIAKVREGSPSLGGETLHTKTGLIVGSLRYISPDQVSNQEITAKTDLYSLGAILYELLCGRRVFDYEAPADCAIAHMSEEPRAPELDGTPMSGPLVDFIMMCLRKNPAERPASADAGVRMLRACRQNPLQAAIESPKTAPRRRPSGMDRSGRVPVPETVQAMPSTAPASGNQARPMMSRGPTTDNHARPMMSRTPTADDHALPVMSRTPPASGNHARPMMSRTPIGELAPVRAAPDVQEIETELEMLAPKQLVAATGPRNALDCTLDGNVEAPGVVTASVAPDALLRARQGGGGADGSRSSLGRTLGWAALLLALGAGAVAFYVYFVKPNI